MTCEEFLLEFNTLYNNVTSNQAPGLNEYEISSFLTMAQEQFIEDVYGGRIYGETYEKTEEIRAQLRSLDKTASIELSPCADDNMDFEFLSLDGTLPSDCLFITMEHVVIDDKYIQTIPIKYDDFLRTRKNPFRGVRKHRCIRLDQDGNHVTLYIDKAYDGPDITYVVNYVRMPNPIIIGNSDFSSLTINGKSCGSDLQCELPSITHRPILLKAVQLAKAAWLSK